MPPSAAAGQCAGQQHMHPPPHARLPALDILRGIAILGTLAVNIWIFAAPQALLHYLAGAPDVMEASLIGRLLQQIPNGKFLALLSLLFGIGIALQLAQARARQAPWYGPYAWRMLLLLADGALHFVLVFEFDILMTYAVTGLLVAWLLTRSPRCRAGWLWSALALHVMLLLALAWLSVLWPPEARDIQTLFPVNPYLADSWMALVHWRLQHAAAFRIEAVFALLLTTALFLTGPRLMAAGLLQPTGAPLRRRLMGIGLLAAPVDLALGVAGGDAGLLLARYGTAPLVALGLLAWGVQAWGSGTPAATAHGPLTRHLAAVGRMALSAYVLQNLLASALFYGWGLGLAAHLGHAPLRIVVTMLVYLALATALLLTAPWWLRRFHQGPLEWLLGRLRLPGGREHGPAPPA